MNSNSVDFYLQILDDFFVNIADDPRITTTHISLFLALFHQWSQSSFIYPMEIERDQIMKLSKISGTATYFRCIKGLHDFGYINYMPAGHRYIRSTVGFSGFEKVMV